jgi:hypothetical protein
MPNNNNRYTWRSSPSQLQRIEQQRFPSEEFQHTINRILERLAGWMELGQAPDTLILDTEPAPKVNKSFRATPIVQDLINQQTGNTQERIDKLLNWATQLPPVHPIQTPEEALGILKRIQVYSGEISTVKALAELKRVCAEDVARSLLWTLHETRKINLKNVLNYGIHLPTRTSKKRYISLNFIDTKPSKY